MGWFFLHPKGCISLASETVCKVLKDPAGGKVLQKSKIFWQQEVKKNKAKKALLFGKIILTFLLPRRDQVPALWQEGECCVCGSTQNQAAFTCYELTSVEKYKGVYRKKPERKRNAEANYFKFLDWGQSHQEMLLL